MSMSTHVVGIKPPPLDEKWKKMKEVWDSCNAAGVEIPEEVGKFFDWETPDDKGVLISLDEKCECCKEWWNDYSSGFEVDVSKIPKDIKIIRFYNSW